ncbi:MAG: DUF3048 domain-containing protein [Candidatus Kerfeldbacteria bacterium]
MAKKMGNSKEYIWGKKKSKKWLIIIISVVVVVAAALGYIIFGFNPDQDSDSNSNKNTNVDSGSLVRRAIDGEYVSFEESNHYPVAVMIENLTVSRPQSGLSQANVVYEALAEGGITRFMAVYASNMVISEIGPIRSARPYFLDWASEYNALYMHAGGSPEALAQIKREGMVDLDQFYNSQYYWRDTSRNVASEHTLYSSGEKIVFALRDKEIDKNGDFDLWKFKEDLKITDRTVEDKYITIDFSSFNYKVEYKYNRDTNDYLRYQAGEAHIDRDDSEVRAKNIIVQKVKTYLVDDQRLGMDTIGKGEAIIFVDGEGTVGTWEKEGIAERTLFYDESGSEIEFNAGPIWVEIVPTDREIDYN